MIDAKNEIERCRQEQLRCLEDAEKEELAYLGICDWFVEELFLTYWKEE